MKRILLIHGPNLNLLGYREKTSSTETLAQINTEIAKLGTNWEMEIAVCQSNHEGDLITWVQAAGYGEEISAGEDAIPEAAYDGIILDAGGYAYTSVALRDAVAVCPIPVIEVHMDHDPDVRSLLSAVCKGHISGLGKESYAAALYAMARLLG